MDNQIEKETVSKTTYLLDTVKLLWKNYVFILKTCGIVGVLTVVYVFSLPRTYTAEVILLPEVTSNNGLSGNLGSLASLAGVRLGGATEDAIYPNFYPKIVGTSDFVVGLFDVEVLPSGMNGKITVWDYFTKHQKGPWWGLLFADDDEDAAEGSVKVDPYRLTKRQEKIVKAVKGVIACRVDKKTDMVTIDVQVQDPEVAAQMADAVKVKLQSYMTEYRTNKARNDLAYMERITKEARNDYLEAQRVYADFCDANQNLSLTTYKQESERMENEMQLAYTVYSQAAQQMQLARAKVQERTPAFTTIQPSSVPLKPSAPKRVVTVIMVLMLTFFVSVLWIVGRDAYLKEKRGTA